MIAHSKPRSPDQPATEGDHDRLVPDHMLAPAIEAILLTVDKSVNAAKLAEALGLGIEPSTKPRIVEAIAELNAAYEQTGRAFRVHEVAGGYRVMTLPELAGPVAAIKGMRDQGKLSKPALEALAIIAYKQPITRAQIEAIRGVASGEVLKTLLERRLASIVGRAEEIGRPMLYGTTKRFLEAFGLASIRDLPSVGEVLTPPTADADAKANADAEPTQQPAATVE